MSGAATGPRARVLMITPGYPPAVGGAEIQCARLSEALAERGVEVRVVTRGVVDGVRDETCRGVVIRRSWPAGVSRAVPARALRALAFLAHVVREVRRIADEPGWVIHHHGLGAGLVAARLAAGRRRPPVVAKVLCSGAGGECARLRTRRRFWPVRWAARDVDRFVALVPAIENELATLGVAAARVVLIPNGVGMPSAGDPASESDPNERVVLFGGRLEPQKDLHTLIDAWREVAAAVPDARLVLAGEGAERASLLVQRDALGLAASVELPGVVADYARRLRSCSVFVLPSRFEGMSNALLEAMAAGRACVASDLAENRHTLGDTGRYFDAGDSRALGTALVEVLSSSAERRRLGALARARVEQRFALDAVADRYGQLYQELLAR